MCGGAAAIAAFAPVGLDMREAPPPAYTGGFGEPTCQACHFDADVNSGAGKAVLHGVPVTYAPGGVYRITVAVTQAQIKAGGFELTARYEDGTQAGSLATAPADRGRAGVTPADGVQYVHHVLAGIEPITHDTVRWALLWTAPQRPGTVVFHLAGNAGNNDESPIGDFIYTASARTTAGK